MLVIDRLRAQAREADESGAVLVTVVIVMFVGFIIAATIAASVTFTIRANDANRDNLDAFVAAESGRDAAVAAIVKNCAISGTITGTVPTFTARVYTENNADVNGGEPRSHTESGLVANQCPTADTDFVLIHSIGTGPDGRTAQIDAVYPWSVTPEEVPGGTVAYFDGQFKATKSTYEGDLVVRQNNYECNSGSAIVGDLWVLGGATGTVGGSVTISTGCTVTGTIYARGTIKTKGGGGQSGINIGGDIIAQGGIDLDADGMIFDGTLHSGNNIDLKKSGTAKDILAVGTIAQGSWTATGIVDDNAAAPVFEPTLDEVYGLTTWIDLGTGSWSTDSEVRSACSLTTTQRANPIALLDDATTRLVIDYTSCSSAINLGAGPVTRDVVFLVADDDGMDVDISGSLTSGAKNQLMFVHADKTMSNDAPDCGHTKNNGTDLEDSFDVSSSLTLQVNILVYSPCGLGGNLQSDFSGQLYTDSDDTRTVQSLFDCESMSWVPALNKLSCTIKGEDGAAGSTVLVQRLDDLTFQTEF